MSSGLPRRIFITGASSGIGYALGLQYAMPGARLGLVARRADALAELAERCRSRGAECLILPADVTSVAEMEAAAGSYLQWAGAPELIIANAGGSHPENQALADSDVLHRVLELNLFGVLNTFRPFLEAMRQAGGGQLAAVASLAGFRGLPFNASYSISKAALIALMEGLRIQVRGTGMRVATICPGYVRTPLTQNNPWMPWLMEADQAARHIQRQLARGKPVIAFPWQMHLLVRTLRLLPPWAYDRAMGQVRRNRREVAQ